MRFEELVELAITQSGARSQRPVIEKELLHFDLLFCLDEAGLLDQLTFQGGTALRLCYGSNRLSEDLDFAGGKQFSSKDLHEIKECIEDYLGARYNIPFHVREPKLLLHEPGYGEVRVDKWQVSVVTSPARPDLPQQRIKLEIASVDAHTREPRPLAKHYNFLPAGYQDTLVMTESMEEIMADKLVAFVASSRYIRYRDIWDLVWLGQRGVVTNTELVRLKVTDYRLDHYETLLSSRIDELSSLVDDGKFYAEMRRFVPAEVQERTLSMPKFMRHVEVSLREQLLGLLKSLYGTRGASFEM
jgi:predicted nucleotidyltransferase component of viral defense system